MHTSPHTRWSLRWILPAGISHLTRNSLTARRWKENIVIGHFVSLVYGHVMQATDTIPHSKICQWLAPPTKRYSIVWYYTVVNYATLLATSGMTLVITRPEESYRLWCVVVCDLEILWMRRPWPTGGCCRVETESGGIWRRTGGEVKGKEVNGVGSQQSSAWLGTVHPVLLQSFSADPHSKKASTRLNWHPRRYKWTRPFRWKTESGFCACAITFRFHSTKGVCVRVCVCVWRGVGYTHNGSKLNESSYTYFYR